MTSANQQIVTAYDEGLSPEEIAEQFEWEPEAVKTVLMSCSRKFYKDVVDQKKRMDKAGDDVSVESNSSISEAEKPLFDDFEVVRAKQAMAGLIDAENELVRLQASKFVINEAKGRHDVKSLKNVTVNIAVINERMLEAKEALRASLEHSNKVLANSPIPV